MAKDKKKEDRGYFSGVFLAYGILVLHVALLILVGVAVVFFRGVVEYMPWILGGGALLVIASGVFFYRKIKKNGEQLREVLNDPVFRGRAVEVKLLGGVATVRLGQPSGIEPPDVISLEGGAPVQMLEDPETARLRHLEQLASMLDKGLLSPEEFERLKKELLGPQNPKAEIIL